MKHIRVYDIEYLYLTDDDYFHEYNRDNDMSEEEIEEHISFVKEKNEVLFKFEDFTIDEGEWNDPKFIESNLVDWVEEETGEYFSNFEWEYLDKLN